MEVSIWRTTIENMYGNTVCNVNDARKLRAKITILQYREITKRLLISCDFVSFSFYFSYFIVISKTKGLGSKF